MHRFFIDRSEIHGNTLHLMGDEWHHCQTVLRAKKGDRIIIFDGKGNEYFTEISDTTKKKATLHLLQRTTTPPFPYTMTLVQALPKSKVMDFIVQKATELGIHEIIPVLSERSVVKLKPTEAHSKITRWRELSIEAGKQCGLNWLPQISLPKTIREVINHRPYYHLAFIGSLQNNAKPLWEYLINSKLGFSGFSNIVIMIGPEGDFTPAETALAQSAGFQPLSLGPLVLRCDTAAIYAISTLSYELRRLSITQEH